MCLIICNKTKLLRNCHLGGLCCTCVYVCMGLSSFKCYMDSNSSSDTGESLWEKTAVNIQTL